MFPGFFSSPKTLWNVVKRGEICSVCNAFATRLQQSYSSNYMGLYGGGLDVDDIHKRKSLEVGQKILDYMGSAELIANLFRKSQTEEKLRKDEISGAKAERKCVALLKR